MPVRCPWRWGYVDDVGAIAGPTATIIVMQGALGSEQEDNCRSSPGPGPAPPPPPPEMAGKRSVRRMLSAECWNSRRSTIIRPGWAVVILRHECTQSPAHPVCVCVCVRVGPKELQDLFLNRGQQACLPSGEKRAKVPSRVQTARHACECG